MVQRIISGGQTGVDRAALDFALANGIPASGWCPKGRKAENGRIPDKYPLKETATDQYEERTFKNVVESDATLVITAGLPAGGTAFTIEAAYELNKPFLLLNLSRGYKAEEVRDWLQAHRVRILNVAGPRASEVEAIYERAFEVMTALFAENLVRK